MTNATKITKKDRYNQLVEILNGATATDEQKTDLVDFCLAQIEQLDKKSAKAKEAAATKKTEADPLTDAIQAVLTDDFATIADVTTKVADADATESKVRYRLNALVEAGVAEKTQVTVPGTDGQKARKLQAYRLIG